MKIQSAALFLVVMAGVGCGGSTVAGITKKQSDALNAATSSTCDRYQACNEIGPGKSYTDRASCETDRKSFWNDRWPVADCDGKINKDKLQFCLDAISTTSCGSFIDAVNTAYGKCPKSDVCSG